MSFAPWTADDCDMDHFEELANWDVGLQRLLHRCWIIEHIPVRPVIPCIHLHPVYLQWRRSYRCFIVFGCILWTGIPAVLDGFGLQKVQTWSTWSSTLPASMAMDRDLFLRNFVKFVTLFLADSRQTTAGTLHMTCWRLLQIFYSGGWDECQNECLCIIAK